MERKCTIHRLGAANDNKGVIMDFLKSVVADCIINDIHVCLKNNAPTGAVLLTYCAIDAMSFLSMPLSKTKASRSDYIAWVEKYMKTDDTQPYQYRGIDLFGARCGIAHNYGVESDLSRQGKCKIFAYRPNGLKHIYDPVNHPEKVVLGVKLFIRDFYDSVDRFLVDIEKDDKLRTRVESRLPKFFSIRKIAATSHKAQKKTRQTGL